MNAKVGDPRSSFGSVERDGDAHVLRYQRRLEHPVEAVWAALTEPARLAEWLWTAERIELRVGGRIVMRPENSPDDLGDWEAHGVQIPEDFDPGATMAGSVTRLRAPRLLEYEIEQMGVMRWELRPDGDGCLLTFTNVIELPPELPPSQTLAGWHVILDSLAEALAGRPVEWTTWTEDRMDGWKAVRDEYERRLSRG